MKIVSYIISRLILICLLFFVIVNPILAKENIVNIYFFYSTGCPHCADEKPFLDKLEQKYPTVKVHHLGITNNQENIKLLQEAEEKLNTNETRVLVPFTIVGEHYFIGWNDETTTGKAIEEAVLCGLNDGCPDVVGSLINNTSNNEPQVHNPVSIPNSLNLPLIGKVDIFNLSLPTLTFVIALVDGFNPCAMWVLLFLISLLLGMEDRKRMWILGVSFIISSSFVYFLFLSAWLNIFLYLGFVFWVRILIGLVAVTAGGFNLQSYIKNKDGGCKVVADKKRKKVFEKIKNITQNKKFLMALLGIVLLAFAVNLVELVCSAGLPAIYTQILALNKLSSLQYYLYLIFYIFIFMLDDLFVFFTAMMTLKLTGIESKYSRYSKLVGGLIIFAIGLLMLFKPEVLMFG